MMPTMKSDPRRARRAPAAVLIVDDDEMVADAAADAIGSAGYRAVCARDGWQALEMLKHEQPAVMLVDLFMPGMSGSEFLRFVRKSEVWSRIPRVVMTATNDPMIGVREDAAVFYKPLDLDSLVEAVRRYCDYPRPRLEAVSETG